MAELIRFHLHLDEADLEPFVHAFKDLVNSFADGNSEESLKPGFGGIFAIHRLADKAATSDEDHEPHAPIRQ